MPKLVYDRSYLLSERLASLSAVEERFFIRLLLSCDHAGRLDGRPAFVTLACFPLRLGHGVREKDVSKWLSLLTTKEILAQYEFESMPYIQMMRWRRQGHFRVSSYPWKDGTTTIRYVTVRMADGTENEYVETSVPANAVVIERHAKVRREPRANPTATQSEPSGNPERTQRQPSCDTVSTRLNTPVETGLPSIPTKAPMHRQCIGDGSGMDAAGGVAEAHDAAPSIRAGARGIDARLLPPEEKIYLPGTTGRGRAAGAAATGNKLGFEGKEKEYRTDYAMAEIPTIEGYDDIRDPDNDVVLLAMAITGEREKCGWGWWTKVFTAARRQYTRVMAEGLIRTVLETLWADQKAGECSQTASMGALLNRRLADALPEAVAEARKR